MACKIDVRVYWTDGNISRYGAQDMKNLFEHIEQRAREMRQEQWDIKYGMPIYTLEDISKLEVLERRG